ncbi:hypothetical protein HHE03_07910 [Helicobacter heilmannii]|uniref:hypothetical protein n=1 Tax=Helicobacter heilmannii TaxID=35817 RepID=UPI0006A1DD82|nr:hypothetical protein [Helicobacter heilmannii]CRF49192.1 hypothetical protein HHE03_07910 [Helicobacter heilmannii]
MASQPTFFPLMSLGAEENSAFIAGSFCPLILKRLLGKKLVACGKPETLEEMMTHNTQIVADSLEISGSIQSLAQDILDEANREKF